MIYSGQKTQGALTNSSYHNFVSLEKLVKLLLEIELDKFFQVADWRIRPLPVGMIEYARCDSHFLIPIFAQLQTMLAQKWAEDSEESKSAKEESQKTKGFQ